MCHFLHLSITCRLKAQPDKCVFATVNPMFSGTSPSFRLLSKLCSILWSDNCALGSSQKQGGAAKHLIDASKNAFVSWALSFRVSNNIVYESGSESTCKSFESSWTKIIKFEGWSSVNWILKMCTIKGLKWFKIKTVTT